MRLHRFYVLQPLGEEVVIEDVSTIKQWLKVFRYTKDDFVILFNGDGNDCTYKLTKTTPTSCTLTLEEKRFLPRSDKKNYLFLSLIKKDLFELVAEKATELGVTDIIPIITARTEKKNINGERLYTIIQEASEQSERGDLLTLHDTRTLDEAFIAVGSFGISKENVYPTTLSGKSIKEILAEKVEGDKNNSPVAFFIGPEGGWTEDEERLFKEKNFTCISLGNTVLRAETAGITCALLSSLL